MELMVHSGMVRYFHTASLVMTDMPFTNAVLRYAQYQTKDKNDVLNWKWKYWTRQQGYDEVFAAARGFIALGLKQWEYVCIMGFNAPQWLMADLAAIYSGGIACGLYTTNNEGQRSATIWRGY